MGLFIEQAFHILLYDFHKGGGKHTSCTLFISIGTDEIIFPGICLRQLLNVFDELYNSLKRIYFLAIFNIKLTKKSGDKLIVGKNICWDVARQAMTERPTIKNIRGKKGAPMHYKCTYSCNIDKPLNGQHKKPLSSNSNTRKNNNRLSDPPSLPPPKKQVFYVWAGRAGGSWRNVGSSQRHENPLGTNMEMTPTLNRQLTRRLTEYRKQGQWVDALYLLEP